MKLDQETRARLAAEHGDAAHFISIGENDFAVRAPSYEQASRFASESPDPKKAMSASRALANDCALWPPAVDLARVFAEKPFHAPKLAHYCAQLAGADDEIVVGKAESC